MKPHVAGGGRVSIRRCHRGLKLATKASAATIELRGQQSLGRRKTKDAYASYVSFCQRELAMGARKAFARAAPGGKNGSLT